MLSDLPPESEVPALRRQLILAQVQIMELDDAREAAVAALARTEARLNDLQRLTDSTLQALEDGRSAQRGQEAHLNDLRMQASERAEQLQQAESARLHAEDQLARQMALAADLQQRLEGIEARFASLRSSRSWRWTAPLRTVERWFRSRSTR